MDERRLAPAQADSLGQLKVFPVNLEVVGGIDAEQIPSVSTGHQEVTAALTRMPLTDTCEIVCLLSCIGCESRTNHGGNDDFHYTVRSPAIGQKGCH